MAQLKADKGVHPSAEGFPVHLPPPPVFSLARVNLAGLN